jgi:hypothetical protein
MNERIKELLEQAGVKYVTMPKDTVYEKFARLIVQECLYIVEGEDDCSADTKSVRLAMIRMKEHFGVE